MRVIHRFINRKSLKASLLDIFLKRKIANKSLGFLRKFPTPMVVVSHEYIGNEITSDGLYEQRALKNLFEALQLFDFQFENGSALDIGANIGNHSRFFSEKFQKVYAFEPDPFIYEILKINTSFFSNIEIYNFALGESNGVSRISGVLSNLGGSSINREQKNGTKIENHSLIQSHQIEIRTLDSLESTFIKLKFIKMDVEGYEEFVIKGGINLINKLKPAIAFEQSSQDFKYGESPVITKLRDLGYNFFWQENYSVSKYTLLKNLSKFFQVATGRRIENLVTGDFIPPADYPLILAVDKSKIPKHFMLENKH